MFKEIGKAFIFIIIATACGYLLFYLIHIY